MPNPIFTSKSATIHRLDYNEAEKYLEIEFRNGSVYRYYGVPPRMWKIMGLYIECGGSAGSYYNEYIRSQYTSERITPAASDEGPKT